VRVDVSMVYSHLTWSLWFFIYMITCLYGVYSIWTDLKGFKGAKENFIMALLVSLWCGLAYGLWTATERFV